MEFEKTPDIVLAISCPPRQLAGFSGQQFKAKA